MHDTAVVLSEDFLKHRCEDPHPENGKRIEPILELFHSDPILKSLPILSPVSASEASLTRVHSPELIAALSKLRGQDGWIDEDTYYGPDSIDTAWKAAGSCVDLGLRIFRGEYRRGFSLVRPPGHHATPEKSMGFCLLNNIALAAAAILEEKPGARIAIVDFDLHHGNGTQNAFYGNPNVLFISSHRYPYYPGTGALGEVGQAQGKGTTINFPLEKAYGDSLFVPLYGELVTSMLKGFRPDMILVSAGFDGHICDPMRGLRVHTESYALLAEILIAAAEETTGKILFCLEGGYDPVSLTESVRVTMDKLINLPRTKLNVALPDSAGPDLAPLEEFRRFHRQFFPELG